MKKRYFLYFCLAVVLGITFMVCNPSRSTPEQNNPGSNGTSQNPPQGYLGYAESAATWLDKVALRNGDRAFWPEYIGIPAWDGPNARPLNLY